MSPDGVIVVSAWQVMHLVKFTWAHQALVGVGHLLRLRKSVAITVRVYGTQLWAMEASACLPMMLTMRMMQQQIEFMTQ